MTGQVSLQRPRRVPRAHQDCEAGAESDFVYKDHGLDAFSDTNGSMPRLRWPPARSAVSFAPAHERVVHTLRAWGTPADEAHFVGSRSKTPVLEAFAPHVFFDDQETHVLAAADSVAAALVPGPHSAGNPVVPAMPTGR